MNGLGKINWDDLYAEWIKSGVKKDYFLRSKGIPPNGMIAKRKTYNWDIDTKSAAKNLKAEFKNEELEEISEAMGSLDKDEEVDETKTDREIQEAKSSDLAHQIKDMRNEDIRRVVRPDIAIREIWQIIAQWRQKQAENDYKLADVIRLHCKVILKNNLRSTRDRNGNQSYESDLKPNELLSIARVAETVQKIQRLALGLSTENIGIESNNRETTGEDNIPIFEVQVNQNGKFIKVR